MSKRRKLLEQDQEFPKAFWPGFPRFLLMFLLNSRLLYRLNRTVHVVIRCKPSYCQRLYWKWNHFLFLVLEAVSDFIIRTQVISLDFLGVRQSFEMRDLFLATQTNQDKSEQAEILVETAWICCKVRELQELTSAMLGSVVLACSLALYSLLKVALAEKIGLDDYFFGNEYIYILSNATTLYVWSVRKCCRSVMYCSVIFKLRKMPLRYTSANRHVGDKNVSSKSFCKTAGYFAARTAFRWIKKEMVFFKKAL